MKEEGVARKIGFSFHDKADLLKEYVYQNREKMHLKF